MRKSTVTASLTEAASLAGLRPEGVSKVKVRIVKSPKGNRKVVDATLGEDDGSVKPLRITALDSVLLRGDDEAMLRLAEWLGEQVSPATPAAPEVSPAIVEHPAGIETSPRCGRLTAHGTKCSRRVSDGRCWQHGGTAPKGHLTTGTTVAATHKPAARRAEPAVRDEAADPALFWALLDTAA